MGRKSRLKAQRRASKVPPLMPDYGSYLLKQKVLPHLYIESGAMVTAHYYPEEGFADFHLSFMSYCVSIYVPCAKNQVQSICDRLGNGFSGVLEPDISKAYVTPQTKERVVPVVFQDLSAFMATVNL